MAVNASAPEPPLTAGRSDDHRGGGVKLKVDRVLAQK